MAELLISILGRSIPDGSRNSNCEILQSRVVPQRKSERS